MIDINLIPAILRKDGKGDANAVTVNIPKEVLFGVGVGLVFIMAIVHLILGGIWFMDNNQLSYKQAQWQKLIPDKNALDAIHKESGDLKKMTKTITDITVKKSVLWAPKFNAISDCLPKGLWIRKMTLDKTGLTIEGSAVSKNHGEINNVDKFLSSLRQDDYFMRDFSSLEVNSIQGGKNNTVDVTDFSVMAKLK